MVQSNLIPKTYPLPRSPFLSLPFTIFNPFSLPKPYPIRLLLLVPTMILSYAPPPSTCATDRYALPAHSSTAPQLPFFAARNTCTPIPCPRHHLHCLSPFRPPPLLFPSFTLFLSFSLVGWFVPSLFLLSSSVSL